MANSDTMNEEHIIYRLDQQDKTSAEHRAEIKEALERDRKELKETFARVFEQFSKGNARISMLERFMYTCSGALLIISLAIGWLVTYFPHS